MSKAVLLDWPVEKCELSPDNPRTVTEDVEELNADGLYDSVGAIGVQQPLQTRDHPRKPGFKEVLAGGRRWTCSKLWGHATVPILDYGDLSDEEAFKITCIENAHRRELRPLEQAKAAALAVQKCHGDIKAAAALLGQSERWIALGAKIHESLTGQWRDSLATNPILRHWTAGHVAQIARFPPNVQDDLHRYWVYGNQQWRAKEITVEELARETADTLRLLAKAPFDSSACDVCPKRSGREPVLWADLAEQATGPQEKCLDAACWRQKETEAAQETVKSLARDHKGLVLVDLSKHSDYQRERDLKELYGKAPLANPECGSKAFEVVKEGTRGAVPAYVTAGPGKGQVKYIKRLEKPGSGSAKPRKTREEKSADQERHAILVAVADQVRERLRDLLPDEVIDKPPYHLGMLFAAAYYGTPYTDRPDFLADWTGSATWQERQRCCLRHLWSQVMEDLMGDVLDPVYHGHDEGWEEDLAPIVAAFGWDFEALAAEAADRIRAEKDREARRQVFEVPLPKKAKARVTLAVLEDGGKWYGCHTVKLPAAGKVAPLRTDEGGLATKAACVRGEVERVTAWLGGEKKDRRCSAELHKQITAALEEVLRACELEDKRSGVETTPSVPSPAARPVPLVDPAAPSTHEANDVGVIQSPEIVAVELPPAARAKIEIQLGHVGGKWYCGWTGHVPGGGNVLPCSINHHGYSERWEAHNAAREKILAWLDQKPGKRTYTHLDEIRRAVEALGPLASGTVAAAAPADEQTDPTRRVLAVNLPSSYEARIEMQTIVREGHWCGGYTARVGEATIDLPPMAGDEPYETREKCLQEIARNISVWMGNAGVAKKTRVQLTSRIEEAVEMEIARMDQARRPHTIAVEFGELSAEASCTLQCQRINGMWHGGFRLQVGEQVAEKPMSGQTAGLGSKAACLGFLAVSTAQWLDSVRTKICNGKLRSQIHEHIQAAVDEEKQRPSCRICGCTQDNCGQCVERTGSPCTWAGSDLCSACAANE